jgi:iron complex outermembrane receptor protein
LPLLAQDAPDAETPDEELPVIVVTAQKISQTQEQVPASLSLVSGETFRESGSTSFTDLQDYTANVAISLSGSAGTFGIRGLTTPDTNTAFDPSVGTVVDGVSYGRSNFLIGLFHDIDHVEVLRGPQGTLFGKNATAGLFNVTTNAPHREFSAGADVLASSYGTVSVRPALNQPIGESAALRLSGNYEFGDGARLDNTFLDRNEDNTRQATTRARLRLLPSDDLTVDIGAFYSRQDAHFNIFQFTQATPEMLAMARTYDPRTETRLDDRTSANFPSREQANLGSLSTTLEYQAPSFLQLIDPTIVSITGWAQAKTLHRDFDADFTAAPFLSDTWPSLRCIGRSRRSCDSRRTRPIFSAGATA